MTIKAWKMLPILAALLLTACGDSKEEAKAEEQAPPPVTESAPQPAAQSAPAEAPVQPVAAAGDVAAGEAVFKKTCALCHQTGAAGAPLVGDKADWEPRVAQGKDTLYKHALEGYNGQKGMMPARGGGANLTDDEVKSAVDYMVSKL